MKYLLDWWLNDGIWHLSDTIERGLMRLLKKECEDEVTRKGRCLYENAIQRREVEEYEFKNIRI